MKSTLLEKPFCYSMLTCSTAMKKGLEMDIRDLKFDDNSFDIVIDKGELVCFSNLFLFYIHVFDIVSIFVNAQRYHGCSHVRPWRRLEPRWRVDTNREGGGRRGGKVGSLDSNNAVTRAMLSRRLACTEWSLYKVIGHESNAIIKT